MIRRLLSQRSLLFFISIGAVSSLLWLGGQSTEEWLMYQREAIASGQFWRVLTGHLVHSNGWHLILNLASLLLIGLLFSQHLTIKFWSLLFTVSGLLISGFYYWYAPEFDSYVGLSAILYSAIIAGALLDLKEQPLIASLVLVVVTGRVIWQQFYGSVDSLAELIDNRVAIESHLFGIISGYLLGLVLLLRQRRLSEAT